MARRQAVLRSFQSEGISVAQLFISYARVERPLVERLTAELSEAENSVWVDWKDIPPTSDWLAEIFRAIRNC